MVLYLSKAIIVFWGEEAIGRKSCNEVHGEVGDRTVSGMLNLSHVLEFIVDTLDNRPLTDKDLVCNSHQCPFHVAPEFCKELYSIYKQFFEQPLAYVPFVPTSFPEMFSRNEELLSGSRSSTLPGVSMKLSSSPLSLQTRCSLKP